MNKYYGNCAVCGTPTDGRYRRGTDLYCQSDFDKTSAQELNQNYFVNLKERIFKKLFDTTR